MTGQPDLNRPLFNSVALALRMAGWDAVNPVELNPCDSAAWADCMRKDIVALMGCDSIVMLPGWEKSRGATIEYRLAADLGMTAYTLADLMAELPDHITQCESLAPLRVQETLFKTDSRNHKVTYTAVKPTKAPSKTGFRSVKATETDLELPKTTAFHPESGQPGGARTPQNSTHSTQEA